MRVCFTVLYYDPAYPEPRSYLARVPIHRELPRALAAMGHRVELVHLFPRDAEFAEGGVRYRFVAPGRPAGLLSRGVGRLLGRDPVLYAPATRAIRAIREARPDLIHFHGATLNWNLFLLLRALGRAAPPVVLHYHGGYPAANLLARAVQRANFRRATRLLFTTLDHARPFLEAGVLEDATRVVEFMETSSGFRPRPRADARRETGMAGDPVFLWAGRLHPIKDPLTALRGFETVARARPGAQLYLHYLTDELLPELQAFVASRPALAGRVHFRGRAPFERMESIFSSADFLLQASLREFSGCAVLEAMACGAIPVVTDIPSFRTMTDGGRCGVLFPRGDAEALAQAVLAIPREDIPSLSSAVRARFDGALSFPALARRLEEIYREVVEGERDRLPPGHQDTKMEMR